MTTVVITLVFVVAALWLATRGFVLENFWPLEWRYKSARILRRLANRVSPDSF